MVTLSTHSEPPVVLTTSISRKIELVLPLAFVTVTAAGARVAQLLALPPELNWNEPTSTLGPTDVHVFGSHDPVRDTGFEQALRRCVPRSGNSWTRPDERLIIVEELRRRVVYGPAGPEGLVEGSDAVIRWNSDCRRHTKQQSDRASLLEASPIPHEAEFLPVESAQSK
jgi:hypothetical protein